MKKLLLILFTLPFLAFSQGKGIHFEHNTTWAKVIAKAKAENKFIFVDVFTTWCGPCTYMSENIFPQEKVGTFFNDKFVNLKLQMDETEGDNEEVKSWREEAKRFAKDYAIAAYPTFLIFDSKGELVHRIVGGGEADQFIAAVQEGLDPKTQYVTLLKKYQANPDDVQAAKDMAKAAIKSYDNKTASEAIATVIEKSKLADLLNKQDVTMLLRAAAKTNTKAFEFIRQNIAKVDEVAGSGKANQTLAMAVINSELTPKLRKADTDIFNQAAEEVTKAYADIHMKDMIANYKVNYYRSKKNWPMYREAVNAIVNAKDSQVTGQELNSYAWTIFENCTDPACIEAAITWSKKSLENNEDPAFLDTYANILHKAGKTKEAIVIQEKALALVDQQAKNEYQATLDKMKKGLPTWETE